MGNSGRIAMIIAGAFMLVAATVLFVPGGDDADDDQDPPATAVTGVTAGQTASPGDDRTTSPTQRDSGGPLLEAGSSQDISVDQGDAVRFRVRSEVDDEVHVHGYNITRTVPAGETVNISFVADLEGVFEIELHETGERVGELTVNP